VGVPSSLLLALNLLAAADAQSKIPVIADARSIRPGELVVLTIRTGPSAAPVTVRAFNRDVPAYAMGGSTWRALVGIDLSVKPGTHRVAIQTADGRHASHTLTVRPRTFRTRTLTVDPAFVTPPPEEAERIAREARELERIWEASQPKRLWEGSFVRPVPQPANSAFGTRSVFNGEPRSQHSGADFASPAGTPIQAPSAGRIVLASSRYFSGNTVVIDHGLGLFSLFAHLSVIGVQKGDTVKAGEEIGRVGATGRVTGPHLHWSVRVNGARIDPLSLLDPRIAKVMNEPRIKTQGNEPRITHGSLVDEPRISADFFTYLR
jgi:murein DD-endopeptidase MepM/ murein hydrolase activator NlpD